MLREAALRGCTRSVLLLWPTTWKTLGRSAVVGMGCLGSAMLGLIFAAACCDDDQPVLGCHTLNAPRTPKLHVWLHAHKQAECHGI